MRPWSVSQLARREARSADSVSCIVCMETDTSIKSEWHQCFTCSAAWCDKCMESMFNTARDHEDVDVELSCPQCRGSISDMQMQTRIDLVLSKLKGCTEEVACPD